MSRTLMEPEKPIVPEATVPAWLKYWYKLPAALRKALIGLLMAAIGSLLTYLGVEPDVVESVREIPVEVKVPVPVPSPLVDRKPVNYEGLEYHGEHPEPLLEREPVRWPTNQITYGIDYASARSLNPPLSDEAIRGAFRQAANWWMEDLDIELVEVPYDQALIPCRFEWIDGPARVLADAYLADGRLTKKPLRLDAAEAWTVGPPAMNQLSAPTVICHELGHSLGLGHDNPNAHAVMRPAYTAAIPRETDNDVARMIAFGYRRREKPPPPATEVLSVPVQIRMKDLETALDKLGRKVVPK